MNNSSKITLFIIFRTLLYIFLLLGEIQSVIKAIDSDWKPIGKREIIYTAAFFTGTGSIIGWLDIPD